jgi:hypothetical protein
MSIEISELDQMQREYKAAVEEWIAAIQQEGALASVNHNVCKSMHGRALGSARRKRAKKAKGAKQAYESALRQEYFNF